jgi:predicted nucleic acid-binding protein
MVKRVYWDSCCFISLIMEEKGRHSDVHSLYQDAERGILTIVSSTLTISEVCRVKCEPRDVPRDRLAADKDEMLDRFFQNDFFEFVELSPSVGSSARRLYRQYPQIKITNDAIHLASAVISNVDEMHTYDSSDLIVLSEKVLTQEHRPLVICPPWPISRNLGI